MASKKNKKRQHSRTVELKRQQEQAKLADEKDRAKKRLDPTARMLLYGDLVFLAIISILDYNSMLSELAGEKDRAKNRLDPTARMLLYGDLVFLALVSLLDHKDLISDLAGGVCTVIGIILLLAALWFQFGKKAGKGPRL